jgi:hypothetical protein
MENEARASYTLTNNGKEAFRIERVKTSCGCTGSIIDNKLVEPGETAEIVGTFSKGKRDGTNRNKLDVFIEGISEPVATLSMIVEIPKLVELKPQIIYWNEQTAKSPQSIRVIFDKDYALTFEKVDYDTELFSIQVMEEDAAAGTLTLQITPKNYDSQLRDTLTLIATGKDGLKAEGRAHIFVQP